MAIVALICRNVVRWGKNIETGQRRATRRAGAAVYSSASSLETLVISIFSMSWLLHFFCAFSRSILVLNGSCHELPICFYLLFTDRVPISDQPTTAGRTHGQVGVQQWQQLLACWLLDCPKLTPALGEACSNHCTSAATGSTILLCICTFHCVDMISLLILGLWECSHVVDHTGVMQESATWASPQAMYTPMSILFLISPSPNLYS